MEFVLPAQPICEFEGWPKVERSARFEMKHACVVLPTLITEELWTESEWYRDANPITVTCPSRGLYSLHSYVVFEDWPLQRETIWIPLVPAGSPILEGPCSWGDKKPWVKQLNIFFHAENY